jgi:ABC-type hemin transport system ATPase subunit
MITLDKLTKRFGPKILFENVSMRFDPGKRYALVGANGAGKSTCSRSSPASRSPTGVGRDPEQAPGRRPPAGPLRLRRRRASSTPC